MIGAHDDASGGPIAHLPLETATVEAGGVRWQIACVSDHDALLAAADGLSAFPFGLLLWESSLVLADVVTERGSVFSGAEVLEIGAGVGLAGLSAARAGARVLQTDHSAEALAVCRLNAANNGIARLAQAAGDWTAWPLTQRFEIVLGADVLYDAGLFNALAAVLECSVDDGGLAILTDPARPQTDAFLGLMRDRGWRITVERRSAAARQPATGRPHADVDVLMFSRTKDIGRGGKAA